MKKTVLIVDDSLAASRKLDRILEEAGDFACIGHARDGLDAIRRHSREPADIIFMDLNMPDMDGLTALRWLKAMDPEVRIIIVSSVGGTDAWCTEALRLGAHTVVSKPIDSEVILRTLRELT